MWKPSLQKANGWPCYLGDQASHARPNGHSDFSRSRRPHYITPAGRGETQPKKTLTIASQAKGTAFSVKPSGIFRKSSHHFLPTIPPPICAGEA